jgi:hypothetical protein
MLPRSPVMRKKFSAPTRGGKRAVSPTPGGEWPATGGSEQDQRRQAQAATKLQALHRGRSGRLSVQAGRSPPKRSASPPGKPKRAAATTKDGAATRIQGVQRRRSGRHLLKRHQADARDDLEEKKAKLASDAEAAATKLQALQRGRSGRHLLRAQVAQERIAEEDKEEKRERKRRARKSTDASRRQRGRDPPPTKPDDAATRLQALQRGNVARAEAARSLVRTSAVPRARCLRL